MGNPAAAAAETQILSVNPQTTALSDVSILLGLLTLEDGTRNVGKELPILAS